jgi:simple sugar transport system ATP-binding protein
MAHAAGQTPVLAASQVSKRFGPVEALLDVSLEVYAGQITCLLGDNGAGKSTLIKVLSGAYVPTSGVLELDGHPATFSAPRASLDAGIATVYQDLATVPLMSVARNFFLGREPTRGVGPLKRLDVAYMSQACKEELARLGIRVRSSAQLVGTLSGGERQVLAIARAMHAGARVLILDEPTSALGVKEARIVLDHTMRARDEGAAVIFISHNVHHAQEVGDRFTVLRRGRSIATFEQGTVTSDELERLMSGERA